MKGRTAAAASRRMGKPPITVEVYSSYARGAKACQDRHIPFLPYRVTSAGGRGGEESLPERFLMLESTAHDPHRPDISRQFAHGPIAPFADQHRHDQDLAFR